jgi:REP element-mobilizing transposase RayT
MPPDPVHGLVAVFPSVPACEVVKQCQEVTSQELREKYPFLKKLSSGWTGAYFAVTAGNAILKCKKVSNAQSL